MPFTKETPQFTHDCDHCKFLGRWVGPYRHDDVKDVNWDLYVCARRNVVARWGNDGPSYTSGLSAARTVAPLTKAFEKAILNGVRFGNNVEMDDLRKQGFEPAWKQYTFNTTLINLLKFRQPPLKDLSEKVRFHVRVRALNRWVTVSQPSFYDMLFSRPDKQSDKDTTLVKYSLTPDTDNPTDFWLW